MNIWVDADACPVLIKKILFKAAERTQISVFFVANQPISVPKSSYIKAIQVPRGFDVADNEIIKRLVSGDLVITADIPLAAEAIAKGGTALNPRGKLYSEENIKGVLTMRDFMDSLRGSEIHTEGSAPLNVKDRQLFANELDKLLVRAQKKK